MTTALITYSLDIGADSELSDGQLDGDEAWDPGDVYVFGAPNPAPGMNGPWDDLLLNGVGFARGRATPPPMAVSRGLRPC